MAVRKIIRMGHPALRRPALTVARDDLGSVALHRLVADMIDTLHEFDHLDGKLYIDHIDDPHKLVFEDEYARYVLPLEEPTPQ